MKIIDTHSHLNFNAYKDDLDQVIKRTLDNNVWVINVGSKYETSKRAVEIAEKYDKGVYAAVGLHPIYAGAGFIKIKTDPQEGNFNIKEESFDREKYKKLALSASRRVVAIGEIGLDYYYRPKTKIKLEQFKQAQKKVFIEQLDLAKELNLPVIIHCRMAHQNLIEILKSKVKSQKLKVNGVIHCFTGNLEEIREYLKLGFYIGLNGIIFKFHPVKSAEGGAKQFNGVNLDEAIKKCPLERILVETDCPYLTPPQEGNERNEPIFIKYIIQKIAEIKDINYQEVAETTAKNARELFNI